ncbi:hypothetical protein Tsubulata_011763 [Turnera subulata]|uniref:Uncharacterized protein n=1 Tax=Turnera subulata TaxID=218843 RepID=A0A9Q0JN33_9ROSI|nr:hypothetical protein Tsubulata_011763 [Turnera subulata]
MDNGQNINGAGAYGGFGMKSLHPKEGTESHNDIATRRLKNRERQRRYRARKRLEADRKRAPPTNKSSLPQVQHEQTGNHYTTISLLPAKRNWKKDARRAHETLSTSISSVAAQNIASQMLCLASGSIPEPPMEWKLHAEDPLGLPTGEQCKMYLSRRDWKSEARNKPK